MEEQCEVKKSTFRKDHEPIYHCMADLEKRIEKLEEQIKDIDLDTPKVYGEYERF